MARWLVPVLALWLASSGAVRAEVVPDGSRLIGQVAIAETLHPAKPPIPDGFTHYADLNIFLAPGTAISPARIEASLERTQTRLTPCRIFLRVNSINRLSGPPLLAYWESMAFSDRLTDWERTLFSLTPPRSAGVVYVKALDWTIGIDGITAVGYGPYILRQTDYLRTPGERAFFRRHMAGYAVLGESVGQWTLAHELGHALMGLGHVGDRDNVMFSGQLARRNDPHFNEAQCARGRSNSPWVRPVPGDRLATRAAPGPR